jgi:hypothetical protein
MLKRPNDNDKTPPDQPTTYHQLAQSSLALEGADASPSMLRLSAPPRTLGASIRLPVSCKAI